MLGKYAGLGQNPLETVRQTLRTTEDVLPAVEVMAEDYVKMSPKINWMIDHWPVTLAAITAAVFTGSFFGAHVAQKRK